MQYSTGLPVSDESAFAECYQRHVIPLQLKTSGDIVYLAGQSGDMPVVSAYRADTGTLLWRTLLILVSGIRRKKSSPSPFLI